MNNPGLTRSAIDIEVSNVELDLDGWLLEGGGAGAGTLTSGVFVNSKSNVTIRNGIIHGFFREINAGGIGTGIIIERIHIDQCTEIGIAVNSGDAVIRNNVVTRTGRSTVNDPNLGSCAICMSGDRSLVENNYVSIVYPLSKPANGI